MTFTQHVEDCADEGHGPCTVIWCDTDIDLLDDDGRVAHSAGTMLWSSHWDAQVHPSHRVNPDHPALDHRSGEAVPVARDEPCQQCLPLMTGAPAAGMGGTHR